MNATLAKHDITLCLMMLSGNEVFDIEFVIVVVVIIMLIIIEIVVN